MTRTAWRIVHRRHARRAWSGGGAARYGGRWNGRGTRVVYTASSRPLAILELLVHLDEAAALAGWVLIPATFDERLLTRLDPKALPARWWTSPPPAACQGLGDDWVREAPSALLAVPSAVVRNEENYLLNPAHAAFGRIEIGAAEPFTLDRRLGGS